MKLNLTTNNTAEEAIKAYLEANVTAILALENANDLPDFNSPEAFFCEPD